MPYTIAWYGYHMVQKESLPCMIKIQIIAHICFLEIEYSSPLRIIRKCSFHFHGLFIDLRFNLPLSMGMISLTLRGRADLALKEMVSPAYVCTYRLSVGVLLRSLSCYADLGENKMPGCFVMSESVLSRSRGMFMPLGLKMVPSKQGQPPIVEQLQGTTSVLGRMFSFSVVL